MSTIASEISAIDPGTRDQRELTTLMLRAAKSDGVHASAIPGVTVIRYSTPSQPLPSLYDPSLCFVVQGRKQAVMARDVFTYDALNYLVVPVTVPVIAQIIEASKERPYLCLRLTLDFALIGELLLDLGPTAVANPRNDRALYLARTSGAMLEALVRLTRLLGEPRDAKVLGPLVMREIHYRALTGELGE